MSPFAAALLGGLVLGWSGLGAEAAAPEKKPEAKTEAKPEAKADAKADTSSEDYRNWFDVSVGGVAIDGDKAQFKRRHQTSRDVFGGIEAFHYEQDIGKKGLLKLDGRGIYDNHDYSLKFDLSHPDIGYVRGGYREYRTWDDASGGYYPRVGQSGLWLPWAGNEELALDRGEFFFQGGLTLPNKPVFTFEYRHEFRDGQKSSLSWGDTGRTGLTGPITTNLRGVVPSIWDLNETRDVFAGDLKHTFGKTDVGLGVSYEYAENKDARYLQRQPGEAANARNVTNRERIDSDMYSAHAFTETRINEKMVFTTGYSMTSMDTDLSGSRIYGPAFEGLFDPRYAGRQSGDSGYTNLIGGSQMRQYVFNLNLMYLPCSHVTIVPSVRVEKNDVDNESTYTAWQAVSRTAPVSQEDRLGNSDRGFLDVSESLEARYTGITNWVFYARGYWLQGDGNQNERLTAIVTGRQDISRESDFDTFAQKYTAGANWYASKKVSLSGQYYHKRRAEDFTHTVDASDNDPTAIGHRYPAYLVEQQYDTDDFNFRVTWKPRSGLSSVTRYDFQLSTIGTRPDLLSEVQSAEQTSHIISETVTWSPLARLYLQAGGSYALDSTDTPITAAFGATPRVLDAHNDYWNLTSSVGYALNPKTDLQASYFYFRANNFEDNSAFSQPYGADSEEHGITASIIHRLRKNLTWTVKYGFFRGEDRLAGGRNDYDAHLIYSSWQYRF